MHIPKHAGLDECFEIATMLIGVVICLAAIGFAGFLALVPLSITWGVITGKKATPQITQEHPKKHLLEDARKRKERYAKSTR